MARAAAEGPADLNRRRVGREANAQPGAVMAQPPDRRRDFALGLGRQAVVERAVSVQPLPSMPICRQSCQAILVGRRCLRLWRLGLLDANGGRGGKRQQAKPTERASLRGTGTAADQRPSAFRQASGNNSDGRHKTTPKTANCKLTTENCQLAVTMERRSIFSFHGLAFRSDNGLGENPAQSRRCICPDLRSASLPAASYS